MKYFSRYSRTTIYKDRIIVTLFNISAHVQLLVANRTLTPILSKLINTNQNQI